MAIKAILLTFFVIGSVAFAGNEGGGGGKGSVCRKADGSVDYVLLLDLWESDKVWGHPIPRSDEAAPVQFERALRNLTNAMDWKAGILELENGQVIKGNDFFYYQMMAEGKKFLNTPPDYAYTRDAYEQVKWQTDIILEPTTDSFEREKPEHCPIEQLVRYEDDLGVIRINQELVLKMPPTDLAALALHEVVYQYLRTNFKGYHEDNSLRVRRAVGLAFSGYQFSKPEDHLAKDNQFITCTSPDNLTRVYLTRLDDDSPYCYQVVPSAINGQPIMGFTKPFVASCPLRNFSDSKDRSYMTIDDIQAAGIETETKDYNNANPPSTSALHKLKSLIFGTKPITPTALSAAAQMLLSGESFELSQSAVGSFDNNGIATGRMELVIYTGNRDNTKGPNNSTGLSAKINVMDLSDPKMPVVVPQLDCR